KRLFQQGNDFYLQLDKGYRYHFQKLMSSPGQFYYQLQDFTDKFQNLYMLSYNLSNKRLERITEPAGRYLQISYTVQGGILVISRVSVSDGRSVLYNYD